MQSKGKRESARTAVILAMSLFCYQPLFAQRPHPLRLQTSEDNREPIIFMRPHNVIHADPESNLAGPPSSAYKPSQKRHAYGFDQIANQGSGQVIAIVDADDDLNFESDLGVFLMASSVCLLAPARTVASGRYMPMVASRRPMPTGASK
jgi:hypothetical protein